MSEKLKPCPFCGDEDPYMSHDGNIYCDVCEVTFVGPARVTTSIDLYADDATVYAWNRRAPSPSLKEALGRRLDAVTGCGDYYHDACGCLCELVDDLRALAATEDQGGA